MNSTSKWIIGVVMAIVAGFFIGYYSHPMKAEKPVMPDVHIAEQTPERDTIIIAAKSTLPDSVAGIYLPIYGLDRKAMSEEVNFYVRIPEQLSLFKKMTLLAERISRFKFSSRPIEVFPLTEQDGKRIARINLKEIANMKSLAASWRNTFQGSTGGWATTVTLKKSFLQPEYTGEWVDGVQFFYEGEPISRDWDHIGLSGVIFRDGN